MYKIPDWPTLHLLGMLASFCNAACKQFVKKVQKFFIESYREVLIQETLACIFPQLVSLMLVAKFSAPICYGIYHTIARWVMVAQPIANLCDHQHSFKNNYWELGRATINLNCVECDKCIAICSKLLHDEHLFPSRGRTTLPYCSSRTPGDRIPRLLCGRNRFTPCLSCQPPTNSTFLSEQTGQPNEAQLQSTCNTRLGSYRIDSMH